MVEEFGRIRPDMQQADPVGSGTPDSERDASAEVMKELFQRTFRPEGYSEIDSQTTPEGAWHFARMYLASMELLSWKYEQKVNEYLINFNMVPKILDRANQLRISMPLGYVKPTEEDVQAGLIPGEHEMDLTRKQKRRGDSKEVKGVKHFFINGVDLGKYDEEGVGKRIDARVTHEVTDEDAREKRSNLATTLDAIVEQIKARETLTLKLAEQETFSGDIEDYLLKYFLSYWKLRIDSRHYGTILRSPETYPGFKEFGQKVVEAIGHFKTTAEGKATIDILVGEGDEKVRKRGILPNNFALPRNRELLEVVIEKYVMPNIGYEDPEPVSNALSSQYSPETRKEAVRQLEKFDNFAAAITALFLVKHFDLDVEWSLSRRGYGKELTPEDIKVLSLETATKDSEKVMYNELRRALEFYGSPTMESPRDAVRSVGYYGSIGCYPRLNTDALSVLTIERPARMPEGEMEKIVRQELAKLRGQRLQNVDINEVLRDNEKKKLLENVTKKLRDVDFVAPEVVKAEIDEMELQPGERKDKIKTAADFVERMEKQGRISLSITDSVWNENRKVERLLNGRPVEFNFETIGLNEVPWDEIQILDDDGNFVDRANIIPSVDKSGQLAVEVEDIGYLDILLGVPTDAFEIPYKLQGFLGYKVFDAVINSDHMKAYEMATKTDFLLKLNKQIDNAINIMATGYNLDSETKKKLNGYVRAVFLGSLAATQWMDETSKEDFELKAQASSRTNFVKKDDAIHGLEQKAKMFKFLPSNEKGEFDPKYHHIFELVAERKAKAPAPGDCVVPSERQPGRMAYLFSVAELKKLMPLYPLGVGGVNREGLS